MKKILFFVVCCLLLVGCDNNEVTGNNDNPNTMTEEQIIDKLIETKNWITTVWNNGICEIKWYLETGTNSVGQTMDVDFVVQVFNDDYKKKDEYINFINLLNDDYALIKTSFNNAIEQADIIIEKVNLITPQPNTQTDYQENITLFNQYFSTFYDKVVDLYTYGD